MAQAQTPPSPVDDPSAGGSLFVDTGAWFAYFYKRDPYHDRARELINAGSRPLVTSTYVFDELLTLLRARTKHGIAVEAGEALRDPATTVLEHVRRSELDVAWNLFRARDDQAYSFTDCTSFVVMDRLGIEHVLSTGRDFENEGYVNLLR